MFDLLMAARATSSAAAAAQTAARSSQDAMEAKTDVRRLDDRLDRLELACAAMWSLLKDVHGFTDEQLLQRAVALDEADGKRDGKVGSGPKVCPSCKRTSPVRSSGKCLWCGASMVEGPFG